MLNTKSFICLDIELTVKSIKNILLLLLWCVVSLIHRLPRPTGESWSRTVVSNFVGAIDGLEQMLHIRGPSI